MKLWVFIDWSCPREFKSFQFSTRNEEQGRSCEPAQTGALVLMPIKCLNTLWSWNPAQLLQFRKSLFMEGERLVGGFVAL